MHNHWLGLDRPQQQGGIPAVETFKRRQQWLQGRRGNNLGWTNPRRDLRDTL